MKNPLFLKAISEYTNRLCITLVDYCNTNWNININRPNVYIRIDLNNTFLQINPNVIHIQFGFNELVKQLLWDEYEEYHEDTEIGSIYCDNWMHYIRIAVCHEFAHIVQQLTETEQNKIDRNIYDFPYNDHNKHWQGIYRTLRTKYENEI